MKIKLVNINQLVNHDRIITESEYITTKKNKKYFH